MLKRFYDDTGVFVRDAYWIGSIGPHSGGVANLVWSKCEQDATNSQVVTDISLARTKKHQHPATFCAARADFSTAELDALASLPGIDELVQEVVDPSDTIDVGYMASDWIECEDSPCGSGHTAGSLIVCLQVPRGCILSTGDTKMQVRRGDVVLINNTLHYSLTQKSTREMKALGALEKMAWLKNEGMLFMTINRRAA